jgi:hypothetical protein
VSFLHPRSRTSAPDCQQKPYTVPDGHVPRTGTCLICPTRTTTKMSCRAAQNSYYHERSCRCDLEILLRCSVYFNLAGNLISRPRRDRIGGGFVRQSRWLRTTTTVTNDRCFWYRLCKCFKALLTTLWGNPDSLLRSFCCFAEKH